MFKNRSVQVKFVKDEKDETENPRTSTHPNDYVEAIRDLGKDGIVGAGILIATYVLADTVRQVVVNNTRPSR